MQILVTGMHRSGTSVAARLVNMMGAYFGAEGSSIGSSEENPKGFWERRDVRDLNDSLLAASGAGWDHPLSYDEGEIPPEELSQLSERAGRIVHGLDAHRPWVVKEPRLSLTLPFWRRHLEVPIVVAVLRNPIEVARSLDRRNSIPVPIGIALWEHYVLEGIRHSQGMARVIVWHHDLIGSPAKATRDLVRQLKAAGARKLSMPTVREIAAFTDPDLHRARAEADELDRYLLPTQRAVWERLVAGELQEITTAQLSAPSREALKAFAGAAARQRKLKAQVKELSEAIAGEKAKPSSSLGVERLASSIAARNEELQRKLDELDASVHSLERTSELTSTRFESTMKGLRKSFLRATGSLEARWDSFEKGARVDAQADQQAREELDRRLTELQATFAPLLDIADPVRSDLCKRREPERAYADRIQAQRLADSRLRAVYASRTWKAGRAIWHLFHLLTLGLLRRDAQRVERKERSGLGTSKTGRRKADPPRPDYSREVRRPVPRAGSRATDVVVTVRDALDDAKRCLESLLDSSDLIRKIVVVDDGSNQATRRWLANLANHRSNVALLRNDRAVGYTRAANQGLRVTDGPYVALLNSDSIVPRGWLERLIECAESALEIGIVGPLSNAASWQSVPHRRSGGDWLVNPLPADIAVDEMAELVEASSLRGFPRVPVLNGFCLLIRRQVLETIGYFDEEAFPDGYGEENDYCLRARKAGFELAVADHAWVYHAKSRSYSHKRRKQLSQVGRSVLDERYGEGAIPEIREILEHHPLLAAARSRVQKALEDLDAPKADAARKPRILFVLPVRNVGGGVHSIVQETGGLRELEVEAAIAVPAAHLERFRACYPSAAEDLFEAFSSIDDLSEKASRCDVIVATIFTSVKMVAELRRLHPHLRMAYYIQDYEPWFCDSDSPLHQEALASYSLVPEMTRFAKTDWLCRTVRERHNVSVYKVTPSLDLSLYHPTFRLFQRRAESLVLSAMVRPQTPRRAPEVTMELLRAIKNRYGDRVAIRIFGCDGNDPLFQDLPQDFPFQNLGVLLREEVADLLRESDIFADASTYQAFGRTALEAMACGCAVVVPAEGGANEYARHRENALVVDTHNAVALEEAVSLLIEDDVLRAGLQSAGAATALSYNVVRAAASILEVLTMPDHLGEGSSRGFAVAGADANGAPPL